MDKFMISITLRPMEHDQEITSIHADPLTCVLLCRRLCCDVFVCTSDSFWDISLGSHVDQVFLIHTHKWISLLTSYTSQSLDVFCHSELVFPRKLLLKIILKQTRCEQTWPETTFEFLIADINVLKMVKSFQFFPLVADVVRFFI